MIALLSFVHIFCVALGVGGGFANLLLALWLRDKPADVKMALAPFMGRLARIGFFCLIGLWITGTGLGHAIYGGFTTMPAAFWAKITLVTALTVLSGGAQLVALGLLPAGLMATPGRRLAVSMAASALACLILLCAALAFT